MIRKRVWAGLIVAIGGLLVLFSFGWSRRTDLFPPPSPTPTPAPPTPTSWPREEFRSPDYGMQAFLWWNWDIAERDLTLIEEAGFTWVKQNVVWLDLEGTQRGIFDWAKLDHIVERAEAHDLDVLLRLDGLPHPAWVTAPTDPPLPVAPEEFAHFCGAIAERYRGRVRAYQVWNEPNLAREWDDQTPDPAGYVELLRACYTAIKEQDPEAAVISAGLAPTGTGPPWALPDGQFLNEMYAAGASPYFDLLGLNAPGYRAPPEMSPDEVAASDYYGNQRFFCFRHVEDMREIMVAHGDGDKQVMILEMGWTTDPHNSDYSWFSVTEEEKANYLVRAFEYAREHWQPWIGPMFVLSIPDPFWTPEEEQYWWAIIDPGWPETNLRPAYEALAEMEK